MAYDNVTFQIVDTATPPNTTKVAVDRLTSGDAQIMKIDKGLDGVEGGPVNWATIESFLRESIFTGRIGQVQASPTANTVLDRIKALLTGIILAEGTNKIGGVYRSFGDLDFGGLAGQVINSVATATLSAEIDVSDKSLIAVHSEYSNATGVVPMQAFLVGYNDTPAKPASRIVTPGNTGLQVGTLETGYYNGEIFFIDTVGAEKVQIRVNGVPSAGASVSVWVAGVK